MYKETIYVCSKCEEVFHSLSKCKAHEKLCGTTAAIRSISMRMHPITGDPMFTSTACRYIPLLSLRDYQPEKIITRSLGYEYIVTTEDMSDAAEKKFKLAMLRRSKRDLKKRIEKDERTLELVEKRIKEEK